MTLPSRSYTRGTPQGKPLDSETVVRLRRVCIRTNVVSVAKGIGINPSTLYALLAGGRALASTVQLLNAYLAKEAP